MIYYEEEKLARKSILQSQLFLKARLLKKIVGFNMSYPELVTLDTLITLLKSEDIRDLPLGLSIYSNEAI